MTIKALPLPSGLCSARQLPRPIGQLDICPSSVPQTQQASHLPCPHSCQKAPAAHAVFISCLATVPPPLMPWPSFSV